jgi:hypothetical protein
VVSGRNRYQLSRGAISFRREPGLGAAALHWANLT